MRFGLTSVVRHGQALALFTSLVAAYYTVTCDEFHAPQWTCNVCGDYERGSAPIKCAPFNATFDDIPTGPIGQYAGTGPSTQEGYAVWDNFIAVNATDASTLQPASPPHYALLGAGSTGVIAFGPPFGGFLYSVRYGCACPSTGIPRPCAVTFSGMCYKLGQEPSAALPYVSTITYSPTSSVNTTLAYAQPVGPEMIQCFNYTVTVVGTDVEAPSVNLFLDEVLYGDYIYFNA